MEINRANGHSSFGLGHYIGIRHYGLVIFHGLGIYLRHLGLVIFHVTRHPSRFHVAGGR
jgi:hypothetical protein